MEIGPVHNDQPTPGRVEAEKSKKDNRPKAGPVPDRVEISADARMKLAALADRALHETSKAHRQSNSGTAPRSPEQATDIRKAETVHDDQRAKLALVRGRIESGFYKLPDVKKEIAERLATEFKNSSDKDKVD